MDASKLLKGLGSGHILTHHIDAFLEDGDFPEAWEISIPTFKYDDGLYHPSGATHEDPRKLYFSRKHVRDINAAGIDQQSLAQRKLSPQLRRTFDCGHMWHGYYGNILTEMGVVSAENVERKIHGCDGLGSGTADLVDVDIPGHGKWLIDMKTMNSREFKSGPRPDTLAKWTAQVNCYMDWLDTEQAFILAIEKDSPHGLREIRILRDDDLIDDIYNRWNYVEECIQNDMPPPCVHPFGEPCSLRDLCYFESDK